MSIQVVLELSTALLLLLLTSTVDAQPPRGGPPGFGGGPDAADQLILKKFDSDGNGVLDRAERSVARAALEKDRGNRRRRGPGGRRGGNREPGTPGPRVSPGEVTCYPDAEFYDPTILRTLFLEFEGEDWEEELAIFKPTDVEVPAVLTVDGKAYPNVGVSFRGASSFFMVPAGLKRSLNISMDLVDNDQKLYGYKSLNLLNCSGDASLISAAVYSKIARQHGVAPKVNFVKVVINGESWGVYANAQQFDKLFLKENFGSKKGTRWKAHGSPRGDAGLRYLGEDVEPYRERFEIKSKDQPEAWSALINLCRLLDETPAEQVEEVLGAFLDIDGALWFLAVDVAVMNSDGYWTRASDFSLYLDGEGRFHIVPHDMNEAFRAAHRGRGGFGRRGPPGGPGGDAPRAREGGGEYSLDPLVALDSDRFLLRSKLLANTRLRARYLKYLRTIAEESLNWQTLGPYVAQMRALIASEVEADTRKLATYPAFDGATSDTNPAAPGSLRDFAEKRSAYLLAHDEIKSLAGSKSNGKTARF